MSQFLIRANQMLLSLSSSLIQGFLGRTQDWSVQNYHFASDITGFIKKKSIFRSFQGQSSFEEFQSLNLYKFTSNYSFQVSFFVSSYKLLVYPTECFSVVQFLQIQRQLSNTETSLRQYPLRFYYSLFARYSRCNIRI